MQVARAAILISLTVLVSVAAQGASVSDIYRMAYDSDPLIGAAEMDVAAAGSAIDQVSGRLLPQVALVSDVKGNVERFENGLGGELFREDVTAINVRQALFDMSLFSSVSRSKATVELRRVRYEDAKALLALNVADAYLNVLAAMDDLNVVEKERETIERQVELVKMLLDKQLARITDLYEVEARRDALIVDQIEATSDLRLAREELDEIAGRRVENVRPIKQDITLAFDTLTLEAWLARAESGNYALLTHKRSIDVSSKFQKEVKSEHWPTLYVDYSASISESGFDKGLDTQSTTNYIGFSFYMPLYSGGATSARVQRAKYESRSIKQQYVKDLRRVRKEIRSAYFEVLSGIKRMDANERSVASSLRSYEATGQSFKAKSSTIVDVLDSLKEWHRSIKNHRQSRYQYAMKYLELKYLVGDIKESDLEVLDGWLQ